MIDLGTKLPPNRIHIFDPVGLIAHDHNNGTSRSSTKSNESVPVSVTISNGVEGIRFPVDAKEEGESNGSSPRLWNNSPGTSPVMGTSPVHHHHHHQAMSPSSRTQAIARGHRELMEMVRDMPESFYELSLKDIVEHRAAIHNASSDLRENRRDEVDVEETKASKNSKKAMGKSESKAKMVRNGSVSNGGMLARTTVFPILLGTKKGKSKSLRTAATFKLPPKAVSSSSGMANGSSVNGTEKEWWKRRTCISSESESGGVGSSSGSVRSTGSSSSSSSRRRQKNRLLPSCCYFSNDKRITSKR